MNQEAGTVGRHEQQQEGRIMSRFLRRTWWAGVAERAVKTAAQVALAGLGTATLVEQVDWRAVISMVVLAVLASVLTSMARPDETDTAVATGWPPRIDGTVVGDASVAD